MQNIRKSSPIQNHRHIDIRRYQAKQKLLVGHFKDKLGKIKLSFNSNEIKLPQLVTIKIQDKIRVRRMMSRENTKFSHNDKTRNDMVQLRNSINSRTILHV